MEGGSQIQGGEGSTEYIANQRRVEWNMRRFPGNSERSMRVRMTLDSPSTPSTLREIGPVSMQFEVPMYNISGLQVLRTVTLVRVAVALLALNGLAA